MSPKDKFVFLEGAERCLQAHDKFSRVPFPQCGWAPANHIGVFSIHYFIYSFILAPEDICQLQRQRRRTTIKGRLSFV